MRRDLVTRTISGTQAEVTVINAETKEVSTKTITLSKTFTELPKITKAVTKALANNEVLVSVDKFDKVNKLYGLPITAFMAHAMELDPETREVLPTATPVAEAEE